VQQFANTVAEPVYIARSIEDSEQYCQQLTRREARNFYWGFVALPKRQRVGIYSLYSFSRQVDDAVDMNGDPTLALAACDMQRQRIDRLYDGSSNVGEADLGNDPVLRVLGETVREFGIPREELLALVRGVEMDLENTCYQTWAELERYTHHVASAVGQMTTRIFGFTDPVALQHASTLGTALQITNILRDVKEDVDLGRVYLPREDLDRFGITEADLSSSNGGPGWQNLIEFEIARARQYYADGLRITHYIPRRAVACVLTMAGLYSRILAQIEADPLVPLHQRARLRKRTKLKVMLGSWLRAV
jgi:phytoene synthase